MVILYSKQGQLANRLWQAAHFISSAIENNYVLIHLGFAEYLIYFDETCVSELNNIGGNCRIVDFKTTSLSDRFAIKYASLSLILFNRIKVHLPKIIEVKIQGSKGFDISQDDFKIKARKKIVLADGWLFMDKNSLIKNADTVRKIFKPNKIFLKNVEKLRHNFFSQYAFVVGVHIRRGDYSTFNKGKYFFSDEDYISFIKQVSLLPCLKNSAIAFFICSDENITIKSIDGVNLIFPTKHLIEDLYALSNCNYIIGPPSTYSAWASFYGKVPLLYIENNKMIFKEEDFKVAGIS
jgi:hypothetical protein